MADFKVAYKKTMIHEGGYVKSPHDVGGETYRGIARNFHPNWKGWKVIDKAKNGPRNFPDCLSLPEYTSLNSVFVPDFFKENYWDIFWGDGMPHQLIADELFDTGVNMGVQRAILFLQKSINILIYRKGIVTVDVLIEDGIFGNKTFAAINTMDPRYIKVLYNLMNLMQGNHYLDYIQKDTRQSKFLVGWLKRVEFKKG